MRLPRASASQMVGEYAPVTNEENALGGRGRGRCSLGNLKNTIQTEDRTPTYDTIEDRGAKCSFLSPQIWTLNNNTEIWNTKIQITLDGPGLTSIALNCSNWIPKIMPTGGASRPFCNCRQIKQSHHPVSTVVMVGVNHVSLAETALVAACSSLEGVDKWNGWAAWFLRQVKI